jgi:hypothetical protein
MEKLKDRWNSPTHPAVKILQAILGAISATALYYSGLPTDWQQLIPSSIIKVLSVVGFVLAFLLQFTTNKKRK